MDSSHLITQLRSPGHSCERDCPDREQSRGVPRVTLSRAPEILPYGAPMGSSSRPREDGKPTLRMSWT